MRGRIHHRPSPPMVVALVALFISTGAGAYAAIKLPANSVGTKQLKNGAVTGAKVKKHSLRAQAFKAGQLPAAPLWAVVSASGQAVHESHVTAVAKLFPGSVAGAYQVTFDRNVTRCALLATLGRTDSQALDPVPGEIGDAYRAGNPDAVFVKTRDSTGGPVDASFHLAVFC